MSTKRTILAG